MQSTDTNPRFELRFRPTARDYMALLRATRHTRAEKLYALIVPAAYWGLALILTMPFLFSDFFRDIFEPYLGDFAPVFFVLVLGVLFYLLHTFVLFPRIIKDTLEGQIIGQGENHIVIDETGITSRVAEMTTQIPWRAVQRVADAHGCILLFIGRNSGLIVPRRVFTTAVEASRFLAFAMQKSGAAA
jgi:hypothetical protein